MAGHTSAFTNILVGVAIAVSGTGLIGVGNKLIDQDRKLTEVGVQVPAIQETVSSLAKTVEAGKLENREALKVLVTRPEIEARFAQAEARFAEVNAKISDSNAKIADVNAKIVTLQALLDSRVPKK